MRTLLALAASIGVVLGLQQPAAAARVRVKQILTATAADPDARGLAQLTLSKKQGAFKVTLRRLDRNASYQLIVNGVRVATVVTNGRGKGRALFRTRARGNDLPLGFDPRGASIVVRSGAGVDVMVAAIAAGGGTGAGDVVCCIPDDSGPECEDRTQSECNAEGGTVVAGARSCLPNPCADAPPVGDDADLVCCLPDDSGPRCEDRTQAACLAGGGVVLSAASCVPEPCVPIPPAAGEIVCCLPDRGGDGTPECEDLSADACLAGGGAVSTATSCTPGPCGTAGGGSGSPSLRVTCERRSGRSKISIDGSDLAPGSYRGRALSGSQSVTSPPRDTVGDEVEFDFDTELDDIAAGATAIPPGFIEGSPAQVTGLLLLGGSVLAESTVTCSER